MERIKPDEQRACESGPCPHWVYGSWGEVSMNYATQGVGMKAAMRHGVSQTQFLFKLYMKVKLMLVEVSRFR